MKKILRNALDLHETVIENINIEKGTIIVGVRPYKHQQHSCPLCGRRCPTYDRSKSHRRWRTPDIGSIVCLLAFVMERIECPEHGVLACKVPWARHGLFNVSF